MNFRETQEHHESTFLQKNAKHSAGAKRWKDEEEDLFRTEYQRDTERILYSDAFRRLRMKTQVFVASGIDQHNRTRMTHTLEVSHTAKSIARPLRLNTDLVEAIALGHDLGHTPFGHAGEAALNECMQLRNCGSFNHNAQSVWILRKTLASREDSEGGFFPGYNLTYDVVEGIWKHTDITSSLKEFKELHHLNPSNPRGCLEAQVTNIADGIAYIYHDIEDGIRNKIITRKEFESFWTKTVNSPFHFNNWTSPFILDLITTNSSSDEISFSPEFSIAFKAIKKFIYEHVILSPTVMASDALGKAKVTTIFDYCVNHPEFLIRKYGEANRYKIDKYGIERAAVDFVQWCGDELATELYENLKSKSFAV